VREDHGHPPHVLVIAAWREAAGLRARITFSDQADETGRTSVGVGGGDRVLEVVTQWLQRIGADLRDRES
jgi:hypothetical protein